MAPGVGLQQEEMWNRLDTGLNNIFSLHVSLVQSLSPVRLFATPWTAARQDSLSITNSRSSLRLTSIKSVTPSSHLILCYPLLLLPPIPPSIRVFSNESTLRMRWKTSFPLVRGKVLEPTCIFLAGWSIPKLIPMTAVDQTQIMCLTPGMPVSPVPSGASLVTQMVKNLPAMWETWVWSLGWEDSLEKGMATYSSVLAWRILWTEELGRGYISRGHKELDMTEWLTL